METTKENSEALKMQRMMAGWIAYKIDREIFSAYKLKVLSTLKEEMGE